ncbi:uncharacterized protein LOC108652836 [Drosophila navojoa]|uniref:uncharacterized protein LOC108652836 n=1 Tax=Drosophila navojoa TaxID=7232 RepID=UPI0008462AA9|nr:uncharacterized protein LOC108652836 [Drosophila navojoa]
MENLPASGWLDREQSKEKQIVAKNCISSSCRQPRARFRGAGIVNGTSVHLIDKCNRQLQSTCHLPVYSGQRMTGQQSLGERTCETASASQSPSKRGRARGRNITNMDIIQLAAAAVAVTVGNRDNHKAPLIDLFNVAAGQLCRRIGGRRRKELQLERTS